MNDGLGDSHALLQILFVSVFVLELALNLAARVMADRDDVGAPVDLPNCDIQCDTDAALDAALVRRLSKPDTAMGIGQTFAKRHDNMLLHDILRPPRRPWVVAILDGLDDLASKLAILSQIGIDAGIRPDLVAVPAIYALASCFGNITRQLGRSGLGIFEQADA